MGFATALHGVSEAAKVGETCRCVSSSWEPRLSLRLLTGSAKRYRVLPGKCLGLCQSNLLGSINKSCYSN